MGLEDTLRSGSSPNFTGDVIPVEFVVVHYTACSLKETLEIFSRPGGTCAHFVIDVDGTVFDLGDFYTGPARRGAHAGKSVFVDQEGKQWEGLNACSIGIELVNLNGNWFDYPEPQLNVLCELLKHLVERYPSLNDPNRIVGHEHIAGFRGKCDPGMRFDWNRLYSQVYPTYKEPFPTRLPLLSPGLIEEFELRQGVKICGEVFEESKWSQFSLQLETFLANAPHSSAKDAT